MFLPVFIEVDEHVYAPHHVQLLVNAKIRMDA
jgi:hypothetical protein